MKKLLVVQNGAKAVQVQRELGENWVVIGYGAALTGRRFDKIFFIDQPINSEVSRSKYLAYIKQLKSKLSPQGTLTELY